MSSTEDKRPQTSLQSRRTLKTHAQQQRPITSSSSAAALGGGGGGFQRNLKTEESVNNHIQQSQQQWNMKFNGSANFKKINLKTSHQDDIEFGFSSQVPSPSQSRQSLMHSFRMPSIKNEMAKKDITATIPKNIPQDKERLYEELMVKKQMINQLVIANHQLTTQGKSLKNELRKQQKLSEFSETNSISSNMSGMRRAASAKGLAGVPVNQVVQTYTSKILHKIHHMLGLNKQSQDSSIVPNLKQQVAVLTVLVAQKESEIAEVKRNVKLTKISEIEVELKTYVDETIRLRRLLQQALQLKELQDDSGEGKAEERFLALASQINGLKNDLAKSEQQNKEISTLLVEKEKQLKEIAKQVSRVERDRAAYKQILNEKQRELDKFEDAGLLGSALFKKSDQESEFKIELEKKVRECNGLQTRVQEKEKRVNELEWKVKELSSEFQDKISESAKEKEALKAKCEKVQLEFNELEEKYNQFVSLKPNKDRRTDTASKSNRRKSYFLELESPQTTRTDFIGTPTQLQQQSQNGGVAATHPSKKRLLLNFEMNALHLAAGEVRARLRFNKIEFSQIGKYLFSREVKKRGEMTLDELKQVLQTEPFGVKNEDDLSLLSGYLIDENGREEQPSSRQPSEESRSNVMFEMESSQAVGAAKSNKIGLIESTLKKCIGYYTIYNKEQHHEQFSEIQKFMTEKEKSLRGMFQACGLVVDRKKWEQFVRTSDFVLDAQLIDYISQVSFEATRSVIVINLSAVLTYFAEHQQQHLQQNHTSGVLFKDISWKSKSGSHGSDEYSEEDQGNKVMTDLQKLQSTEDRYSNVGGNDTVRDDMISSGGRQDYSNHAYLGTPKSSAAAAAAVGEFDHEGEGEIYLERQRNHQVKMTRIDEEEDVSSHFKQVEEADEEDEVDNENNENRHNNNHNIKTKKTNVSSENEIEL